MRRLDRITASRWKRLHHPNKLWSKHAALCAATVGPDYSATGITLERYKTHWLCRAWLALSDFRADVSPATKGNTEKKKYLWIKKKEKKKDEQKRLTLSPSDIKERFIPSAAAALRDWTVQILRICWRWNSGVLLKLGSLPHAVIVDERREVLLVLIPLFKCSAGFWIGLFFQMFKENMKLSKMQCGNQIFVFRCRFLW